MRIGIIGAGFAGLAAARETAKAGCETVLFSNESVPPYFRPRLPAMAFGGIEPDSISMHPFDWYGGNGIDLRLDAGIARVSVDGGVELGDGRTEEFDYLILTTGAGPILPPFARAALSDAVLPLWNYNDALAIRNRLRTGMSLVVIGGGIIGIETALRATAAGCAVTIVEKAPMLMARNFGGKASRIIAAELKGKGIAIMTGEMVKSLDCAASGAVRVGLADSVIESDMAVLSLGAAIDAGLAAEAGLEAGRGILVDDNLRCSSPAVFAAGDVAQFPTPTVCSAKEALAQGKMAGINAAAAARGGELSTYRPKPATMRFKDGGFEIYSVGAPPSGDDREEDILQFGDGVYRALVYDNSNRLVGVQMVGSDEDFGVYERELIERADETGDEK